MKSGAEIDLTGATKKGRARASAILWLSLAMTLGALCGASTAAAEDTYLFDAELSLRGDCITDAIDPIPDPPIADCAAGAHPSAPLSNPHGVAVDPHGDIYVSATDKITRESRVVVFNPEGLYISEFDVPATIRAMAVDSEGNLYLREVPPSNAAGRVNRYEPEKYSPQTSEITYDPTPILISAGGNVPGNGDLAVNPLNDHLFVYEEVFIEEYSSAAEGNVAQNAEIGQGLIRGVGMALDAAHDRLYSTDKALNFSARRVQVFKLSGSHELLKTVEGGETPAESFGETLGAMAANEATGHFFVEDISSKLVYEFGPDYKYLHTIEHGFQPAEPAGMAVVNGPTAATQGYLFKTSVKTNAGHLFAFRPPEPSGAPEVSVSFGEVTETDALLRATINPNGSATNYTFEYTTEDDTGFADAIVASEGVVPAGHEGVEVSTTASGLLPETSYRFRVVATNEATGDNQGEDETTFATYAAVLGSGSCPNDALRSGSSVSLPDCRAYELVTPPDTNRRSPRGLITDGVPSLLASPQGNAASFLVNGGSLPGAEGNGAFNGQNYLSTRTPNGWETILAAPNGSETVAGSSGGVSPDQGYSFWSTQKEEEGTAVIDDLKTTYVRYPDGHSELVGRGSLDSDSQALGKLISEDGGHIIFETIKVDTALPRQIEPTAPPTGTRAVYDRTADEVTHVVSLLPGDKTPAAGENALYAGASYDGMGVAFSIGTTLYLRVNDSTTFEIGTNVTFAGITEGAARIFYIESGNLFAFDVATEQTIQFTESANATVVNVAEGGDAAYFISPSVLTGEENPKGQTPSPGGQNLYLSVEGAISFVGTVTDRDVEGQPSNVGQINGLGLWTVALETGAPGKDPSRASSDGAVLLFESRADLTGFESAGHAQVFRYDSTTPSLSCLSCNPTTAVPGSDSNLESIAAISNGVIGSEARLPNLRSDGRRAFFESSEPLTASDTDGVQDVYEWEELGVGSCRRSTGCLSLISSGRSARDNFLYAISETGDDVFFSSSDQLLDRDLGPTSSIYDARVGGGFSESQSTPCSGEGCRPPLSEGPRLPNPRSEGSEQKAPTCPKGKRRVKRHGKVQCVKKHKHPKQHHRKQTSKGGTGK